MINRQLSKLTDLELVAKAKSTALTEREALMDLLHLLKEVHKRRLHLEYGYGSLLDFTVKELGFDEASANRRVKAMQLISDIPEVEEKIKMGEMGLTVAAIVQGFLKSEAKVSLKPVSLERKQEVLAKIHGKSLRDVQSQLAILNPQVIPQDKERVLTEDKIEVKAIISKDLKVKLDRLRNLLSHKNPHMNFDELLNEVADIALEKLDRTKQTKQTKEATETKQTMEAIQTKQTTEKLRRTTPASPQSKIEPQKQEMTQRHTRFIPEKIKRKIWQRDQGRCTFMSPITKQKCRSQFQLQIDHIVPLSLNGSNQEDNLRLICSNHNKLLATQILGKRVMAPYLSS
jgi:5-methylcytosine-specific restriction endonuclease McrA